MFRVLLADTSGKEEARALKVRIGLSREQPGARGVSIHLQHSLGFERGKDSLYESAKAGCELAYRILEGEGFLRGKWLVRFDIEGHVNSVGGSAGLLFAIAGLVHKFRGPSLISPVIAATGTLGTQGDILAVGAIGAKLDCAVRELHGNVGGIVFCPSANRADVDVWLARNALPENVRLIPVAHVDEVLAHLGITLNKVYLHDPFRGLESFQYEHRAIYFGREAEAAALVGILLRREEHGEAGVLVLGASGSGKSSLLQAGVLPALVEPALITQDELRERMPPASLRHAVWRPGTAVAGTDESSITHSIWQCWGRLPELDAPAWQGERPDNLSALSTRWAYCWSSGSRFVWIVDQLEELFTSGFSEQAITAFGAFLGALQRQRAWVLASLRTDFLPQLYACETLRRVFEGAEGHFYLRPMKRAALDDVILRPAQAAGLEFETDADTGSSLAETLREEVSGDGEALPLIEFTLAELYRLRVGNRLTLRAYRTLGGLRGAVANRANEATARLDESSRRQLPPLLGRLVKITSSDGEMAYVRTRASLREFTAVEQNLLAVLVSARLLVRMQAADSSEPSIELAHEALARQWAPLSTWLSEHQRQLLWRQDVLLPLFRTWFSRGRPSNCLLPSSLLQETRSLRRALSLSPDEVAYVETSERHRRSVRLSWAAAAVLVLAVSGVVTVFANRRASEARDERMMAAFQSLEVRGWNALSRRNLPETMGFALGGNDAAFAYSGSAGDALHDRWRLLAASALSRTRTVRHLLTHGGMLLSVAYSADGKHIGTTSSDGTARIWDRSSGRELHTLRGHTSWVTVIAFSRTGERVATSSNDGTVRLWDLASGKLKKTWPGSRELAWSLAFSPDDRRLLFVGAAGAGLIDVSSDAGLRLLSVGPDTNVRNAFFGCDDSAILVFGSGGEFIRADASQVTKLERRQLPVAPIQDVIIKSDCSRAMVKSLGTVRLIDLFTLRTRMEADFAGRINAFSPDGTRIVSTTPLDVTQGVATIWDVTTGGNFDLRGHEGKVLSAAFSPEGAEVITGGDDGTARIWDVARSPQKRTFRTGALMASLVIAHDATRILGVLNDRSIQVWDTASGLAVSAPIGRRAEFGALSPDGSLALVSEEDLVGIWNVSGGAARLEIELCARSAPPHQVYLRRAGESAERCTTPLLAHGQFGPRDGILFVQDRVNGVAYFFDIAKRTQISQINWDKREILGAGFSTDGRELATSRTDGSVSVWDIRSGKESIRLEGHAQAVAGVSFSPDGGRLVTAGFDSTARIWDRSTGRELRRLTFSHPVFVARFSRDGSIVATGAMNGAVRIWDAQQGHVLVSYQAQETGVTALAFSAKGGELIAGDADHVRLWDTGHFAASFADLRDVMCKAYLSPAQQRRLSNELVTLLASSRSRKESAADVNVCRALTARTP